MRISKDIGGGNSGVEAAIDLSYVANYVTLLEFLLDLKADTVLQKRLCQGDCQWDVLFVTKII